MGVTAVIGLQWGDEGKGKVVDVACERADVVARCQGGANAGHTVVVDGRKFVLHLLPAGILRENVKCLIATGVAVDLEVLASELRQLEEVGIKASGRLVVSRRAHLVLPLHKHADRAEEAARGGLKIGTTLRGIGPCYSHKYARLGVRVGDLLSPSTLDDRLSALGQALAAGPRDHPRPDLDETHQYCRSHLQMVREISGDTVSALMDALAENKRVVLEGAQGFLLDVDYGTYPYVTSSNTGIHGLISGTGLPPSSIDKVVGVVKAYVTRVGEGPLPTEMEEPHQTAVRERGGEFGATTGRARRCGWLDLVALDYACRLNGVTSLAVTKLDTLSGLDTLKVCVEYQGPGAAVSAFPSEVDLLAKCVPRYALAETWSTLDSARHLADLPGSARRYLDRITACAGSKLEMVSVGPARADVIRVED